MLRRFLFLPGIVVLTVGLFDSMSAAQVDDEHVGGEGPGEQHRRVVLAVARGHGEDGASEFGEAGAQRHHRDGLVGPGRVGGARP